MEISDHIAALRGGGELLASAAGTAGLDAVVPTCPGWRVRDLLQHIGGVHRWAASYVLTGKDRPSTDEEDAAFFAAPGDDDLLAWFRDGHAALVAREGTGRRSPRGGRGVVPPNDGTRRPGP